MGQNYDHYYEGVINDALEGPVVAAAPGYFAIDASFREDPRKYAVLAWRVGSEVVLPVTRWGCDGKEQWVVYPDGTVNLHSPPGPSEVSSYPSFDAWAASELAPPPVAPIRGF